MALIRYVPSYALATFLAVPALTVIGSAWGGGISNFWTHLSETRLGTYAATTLLLVIFVSIGTLLFGCLAAWLIAAYEFPGRKFLGLALVLPFAMPAYLASYTIVDTFQATGPIAAALSWTMESSFLWPEIRSFPIAVLILTLALYPYIYLLMLASLMRESSTIHEAARTLGLSGPGIFFKLALPLSRAAISAGVLLVALETMNEYGAIEHFSLDALSTGIFRAWYGYGSKETALQMVAALSMIATAVVFLERFLRGGRKRESHREKPVSHRRMKLSGGSALAATAFCSTLPLIGFMLPLSILTVHAIRGGDSALYAENIFALSSRSVALAAGCALLCLAVGLTCAWPVRHEPKHQVVMGVLGTFGYAVPGSMIAIGTILTFSTSGGMLPLLLFSYVAKFACIATLSVEAGLGRIGRSLEMAARTLGESSFGTLKRVTLPLLLPAVGSAFLLTYTDILKELSIVALLRPFDFEVLSVHIHSLASDERLRAASFPALILIFLSLPPLLWLSRGVQK